MVDSTSVKAPAKPGSIPERAVWDGGIDGGNWIDCESIDSTGNIFYCTVYSDFSGDVIYEGKMKLEGRKTSEMELRNLLGIYSGDEIYLKDKRVLHSLVPINSIKMKL